jgi:hypothetical protein
MANINRNNPTTHESGMVICDSLSKGTLIGKSSYAFAGNPTGLAISQNVTAGNSVLFNSPSLLNLGSIFPGQPVTLTITLTSVAITNLVIKGYNNHNSITETIIVSAGTSTLTSSNSYTNVNSIIPVGNLTNVTVGTNPLIVTNTAGVTQPQLAASLDINSQAGAVLFPKATIAQIQAFDSQVNSVNYASTDGMRIYNTSTGSFCEKVNGYWSGLYLEDPIKPTTKKISTYVDAATLTAIGSGTIFQILPALPSYAANNTGLAPSLTPVANKAATITAMPYPAQVTATIAGTITSFVVKITGYYNGILFSETLSGSAAGTLTSVAKFTSIVSILPTTVSGTFTVSYGYTANSSAYMIYKAVTRFNGGAGGSSSGTGAFGLNSGATANTNFIQLLTNAQVNGNSSLIELIQPNNIPSSNLSITLSNNATAFVPHTNSSAFVTIEYDIIW